MPTFNGNYPPHKQPTAQQTRHWLTWLAQQLQAQSEDEFLIEKMQPYMLANRKQKMLYGILTGYLSGSLGGIIFGIAIGSLYGLPYGAFIYLGGCLAGIIIGLLIGGRGSIVRVEKLKFSISYSTLISLLSELSKGLLLGFMGSLFVFPVSSLIWGFHLGLIGTISIGAVWGLCLGISFGIINSFKTEMNARVNPNQGICSSFENIFFVAFSLIPVLLLFGIALAFIARNWLEKDQFIRIFLAISCAFLYALTINSGLACAKHLALRITLHRTNAIPWNYARFLNHCTERLLLQRVGGRYRFIHRLVQERFAATGGHRL